MTCPVRSLSRYRGISDLGRCTFLSVDSTALIRQLLCAELCAAVLLFIGLFPAQHRPQKQS